jgi:hypothetical protein
MFDLMQQASEVVLGIRLEDMEESEDQLPVDNGAGPWEVNGWLLDAMELRFKLASQAPVQRCAGEGGE